MNVSPNDDQDDCPWKQFKPFLSTLSSEMNFVELAQIQFWTNLAFQHLGSIFQILFGLQIPTFLTPGI